MVDALQTEKKSPWSKPLVMGIGLVIVAVLIVGIYAPDVFKFSSGGQTGGKIYQRDTGVLGFMSDVLSYKDNPTNPYVIVWADSLEGSSVQTSSIGFVGTYGISKSAKFNDPNNPIPDTDKIIVANKEDDALINSLFTEWAPGTKDTALLYIDQDKRSLTVVGTTTSATSYAVNFLKEHGTERSCFVGKETATILVIPNNGQCSDVYSPRAKLLVSSSPSASVSLKTSTGGPTFAETGSEYTIASTPTEYHVTKGDYKIALTASGYNGKEEIVSVSLADQLQENTLSKSYSLVPLVTTGSVVIEVSADTGAPILTTASVTLEGPNVVKTTDATTHKAQFDNLNPGPYTFTIRPTESYYLQKSTSVTVVIGQTVTGIVLYHINEVTCQPTYDNPQYGACISKVKTRTLTKIAGVDGLICPVGESTRTETQSCCLEAYTQCSEADWTPQCSPTTQITQTRPCNIVAGCEQSTEPVPQKSRQCPVASQATVVFTTIPAEATLAINGINQQKQLPLSEGTYNIKASLAGYDDFTTTLTISQSQLGTIINAPEYVLTPHSDFVFDRIKTTRNVDRYAVVIGTEVSGHKASLSDNIGGSDIAGYLGVSEAFTDIGVPQSSKNIILVGGPCVNNKVAAFAASGKFPYTCSNWPGGAGSNFVIIKQIKSRDESVIVIAGTNAEDTRRGGRVVARLSEFRGKLGKQEVKLCPVNQDVNSADYKDINKIQDCTDSGTSTSTPSITTTSLSQATQGTSYLSQLSATGGTAPYTFSISSGSLPSGLSLASGGTISGTPSVSGTFPLTIKVADSVSQITTKDFSLTVATSTTQSLSATASGPNAKNAFAPASFTATATGGTAPYTYVWDFGDGTSTSQNPTHSYTNAEGGVYTVTLTVTDSAGQTKIVTRTITIFPSV